MHWLRPSGPCAPSPTTRPGGGAASSGPSKGSATTPPSTARPEARSSPIRPTWPLFRRRLAGINGRPRFGTGAVTVSSLTAQRGVPHRVVCLLGLDDDVAEDPCPHRRTWRRIRPAWATAMPAANSVPSSSTPSSPRATGSSCSAPATTCAPTPRCPPVVAVAELLDVIDATVRAPDAVGPAPAERSDHRRPPPAGLGPSRLRRRRPRRRGAVELRHRRPGCGVGTTTHDRHPALLARASRGARARRPRAPRRTGRRLHQAGRGPPAHPAGREPGPRARRPRRPHHSHPRRPGELDAGRHPPAGSPRPGGVVEHCRRKGRLGAPRAAAGSRAPTRLRRRGHRHRRRSRAAPGRRHGRGARRGGLRPTSDRRRRRATRQSTARCS